MSRGVGSPHPRGTRTMLLTAFLASATVPALLSWIHGKHVDQIREETRRIEGRLKPESVERSSSPTWGGSADPQRWARWMPPADGLRYRNELLFSPDEIDQFEEYLARDETIEQQVRAPERPSTDVTRDWVELNWEPPAGQAALRSQLGEDSLLRLGYRVYRWAEKEEPVLLASNEVTRTFFRDTDLPLWSQRYSYCVATVLEGEIDNRTTLIESKRSSVIAVETLENFSVEVLEGSADAATVKISAYQGGRWRQQTFPVLPGEELGGTREVDGQRLDFGTGLRLVDIEVQKNSAEEAVQRLEFLPDGKRRVDLSTGLPTFRNVTYRVPTRTLVLHCEDRNQRGRIFRSSPLR